MHNQAEPRGILTISTLAMPGDTNVNGDIFGGWLVSHMDMGGSIEGTRRSRCRVVTAAIDKMQFILPVSVGDTVQCYAELLKVGRTSMQFLVEAWTVSLTDRIHKKVAEGIFTFVAIDENRRPQPVDR